MKPIISVVLPVYNGVITIKAAVESILDQTYDNFELIVINDGSTDETSEILASFNDKRLTVLNQKNQGLAASLNRGIQQSKGKYIARIDADDIAFPERLQKQVNFMEANPAIVVMGTAARLIYSNSTQRVRYRPLDTASIRKNIIKICPFTHSSVMIRKDVLDKVGLYDVAKDGAKKTLVEDYDLWVRILAAGYEMANTAEVLMICHRNPGSVMRGRSFWKRLEQQILSRKNAIKTLNLSFASYFNLIPVIVLNVASHYGLKLDFFFKILSKLKGRRIK